MKAISAEELSKTFSGGTVAVDEIRFSLDQGEIFGFLKCRVLGIDPTQNPEQLHEKVGVVTEHALVNIFWTQNYKNYSVTA